MGNTSQTSHPDSTANIRLRKGDTAYRTAAYGSDYNGGTVPSNTWEMRALTIDSSRNAIYYVN